MNARVQDGPMSVAAGFVAPTLVASLLALMASSAAAERLPLRTYTTEDGLAHARVRRIVADPRGFLWFCTIDGLSRFDGAVFVTYRTADGLADPWVTDVLPARDGTHWVATNNGVARFDIVARRIADDGRSAAGQRPAPLFTPVAFEGPETQRQVRVLIEDRAGRIWAGGRGGLSVLDRRDRTARFRSVVPSPPAMVTSLLEDAENGLWIGTLAGLFHRGPSGVLHAVSAAAPAGALHVRALIVDRQRRLWVGHDEGLLVLGPGPAHAWLAPSATLKLRECGEGRPPDRRLRLPTQAGDACAVSAADGLLDPRVRALSLGSDGYVRVGTVGGLSDVDDSRITRVGPAQGLAADAINAIAEDRDGNLWIGTDTSGAVRLAAFGLVSYFVADGLKHDFITSLMEDDAGQVIAVSGAYHTINTYDGRRFVPARFNVPRRVPGDQYFTVLRDHQGAWWVGARTGLYRFPRVTTTVSVARAAPEAHYARRHGLPSDDVFPLFEDARGDVWLIAQSPDQVRLARWRRTTDDFRIYGASDGLPHLASRPAVSRPAIVEAGGRLWIGFRETGLFAYHDGRFDAVLDRGRAFGVSALHLDTRHRMWVIGTDGAVRRLDDVSTRDLVSDAHVARSLIGATVRCIVEDASGRFYFGTTSGVIEVDPETGHTWRHTTEEGLARNEVWSALVSRRGELWFGTIAGLSRLDGTRLRRWTRAPRTLISSVHVNGNPRLISEFGDDAVSGLTLAPGERGVAIGFFALSFAPGERLRYQHRLDGADEDWSTPSVERVARYAHLASGRYRFQVRSITSAGPTGAASTGPAPAAVEFEILPPLVQRWWFQTGLIAAAILAAFGAHRYRVARLVALERVRMRIASDLHDDIGGSLSRISIQCEVACREAAALGHQAVRRLTDVADSARGLVDALGDVVWSVDPRRDDLASVCRRLRAYTDDVFAGTGVRWSYAATANLARVRLDPQARRHLFLLLKEGVTNIARHAAARRVSLEIGLTGHELYATLRDDGRGFDPAVIDGAADHHGLLSMRARADQLGARLTIDSSPNGGTTISLLVPTPGLRQRISMLLLGWLR
jgi:ligand-binding sensor domain-containing protein/signal transduction histidine kinase